MKKIFLKIMIIFTICFMINFITDNIFASKIIKDDLNNSLKKLNEFDKDINCISLTEDTINLKYYNNNYIIKYDLNGNPKFEFTIDVKKGMSYNEFFGELENLVEIPGIGYTSIASYYGVEVEDSLSYYFYNYLIESLKQASEEKNYYVIIDDVNVSDDVKIDKNTDKYTIYASEFGERIMEYVNYEFEQPQIISDVDEINSYNLKVEKIPVTDEYCKLVATLNVNENTDFSSLKGFTEKMEEKLLIQDITEDNADYLIELKVGQVCNLISKEEINGYSMYGSCVELINNGTVINALKKGKANGILYIGDNEKTVYIIVKESDGNIEPITFDLDKINVITDLSISKLNYSFDNKKSQKIEVNITPKNAKNKNLKFTSDNTKIAVVSSSGIISPISEGKCNITVKTQDGSNIQKNITVNVSLPYTTGDIDGNNKLDVTDAYQLLTKISKSRSISNDEKEKVDINEDGNVDVTDAYLQLKLISEM